MDVKATRVGDNAEFTITTSDGKTFSFAGPVQEIWRMTDSLLKQLGNRRSHP